MSTDTTGASLSPSLLVLHGFKRHRPGDYARLGMETPARLNQHAHALVRLSRPFACVQVREGLGRKSN